MASIQAPFSTRRKYAYTIGARHFELLGDSVLPSPRRWYLPMCFLLPCTVCYLHATTVSHTRRMYCIACHSWFCLTKEAEGTEVNAGSHIYTGCECECASPNHINFGIFKNQYWLVIGKNGQLSTTRVPTYLTCMVWNLFRSG
jgi:hypothetical protein